MPREIFFLCKKCTHYKGSGHAGNTGAGNHLLAIEDITTAKTGAGNNLLAIEDIKGSVSSQVRVRGRTEGGAREEGERAGGGRAEGRTPLSGADCAELRGGLRLRREELGERAETPLSGADCAELRGGLRLRREELGERVVVERRAQNIVVCRADTHIEDHVHMCYARSTFGRDTCVCREDTSHETMLIHTRTHSKIPPAHPAKCGDQHLLQKKLGAATTHDGQRGPNDWDGQENDWGQENNWGGQGGLRLRREELGERAELRGGLRLRREELAERLRGRGKNYDGKGAVGREQQGLEDGWDGARGAAAGANRPVGRIPIHEPIAIVRGQRGQAPAA